jgi:hypothetical protein
MPSHTPIRFLYAYFLIKNLLLLAEIYTLVNFCELFCFAHNSDCKSNVNSAKSMSMKEWYLSKMVFSRIKRRCKMRPTKEDQLPYLAKSFSLSKLAT